MSADDEDRVISSLTCKLTHTDTLTEDTYSHDSSTIDNHTSVYVSELEDVSEKW